MYNYINEIKRLAKEKKIKLKYLAKQIGMTEVGFHQAIKNNTLKIEILFKICEILEVSPGELLQEDAKEIKYVLNEDKADYSMNEKEMLKEVLRTVKNIERQINKGKPG